MAGSKMGGTLKMAVGISVLLIAIIPLGIIFAPGFGAVGVVIWLSAVAAAVFTIVRYHSQCTSYKCPSCGTTFKISILADFFSPHTPEKKKVRCPACGIKDWCEVAD